MASVSRTRRRDLPGNSFPIKGKGNSENILAKIKATEFLDHRAIRSFPARQMLFHTETDIGKQGGRPMTAALKIVVADDDATFVRFCQETLASLGHEVVGTASSGAELVAKCLEAQPDLVITDIKMPDMDGIEAARQIYQQTAMPFILVTGHPDPEFLERAGASYILAYLIKPIKAKDLQPAISIAVRRFAEFQALRQESSDLRQALQERKIIERAKGILMQRAGLDEAAAFARMQKMARDSNRKLVHMAEIFLTADEAFERLTPPNS
jgi:two-component system, response regulator PdtaR